MTLFGRHALSGSMAPYRSEMSFEFLDTTGELGFSAEVYSKIMGLNVLRLMKMN